LLLANSGVMVGKCAKPLNSHMPSSFLHSAPCPASQLHVFFAADVSRGHGANVEPFVLFDIVPGGRGRDPLPRRPPRTRKPDMQAFLLHTASLLRSLRSVLSQPPAVSCCLTRVLLLVFSIGLRSERFQYVGQLISFPLVTALRPPAFRAESRRLLFGRLHKLLCDGSTDFLCFVHHRLTAILASPDATRYTPKPWPNTGPSSFPNEDPFGAVCALLDPGKVGNASQNGILMAFRPQRNGSPHLPNGVSWPINNTPPTAGICFAGRHYCLNLAQHSLRPACLGLTRRRCTVYRSSPHLAHLMPHPTPPFFFVSA